MPLLLGCAELAAQPLATAPKDKCIELGFSDGSKEFEECMIMLAPAAPQSVQPAQRPTPGPTAPNAARLTAVQSITKPQTQDAGENEYFYGFNLWSAGFYPEARQQLTKFVEQYPNHPRISFGRHFLGRAFLDDRKPEEAARWFLRNYQVDKTGYRASDSLLYLSSAMLTLGDKKRACIALREFVEVYAVEATGRLASEYLNLKQSLSCV